MFFFKRKAKQAQANLIVYKPGFREVVDEKKHELTRKTLNNVNKRLQRLGLR